jgi:hypothetical protein
MAAFAAHVGKWAEDQLASFHLKRLLNGAKGTRRVPIVFNFNFGFPLVASRGRSHTDL